MGGQMIRRVLVLAAALALSVSVGCAPATPAPTAQPPAPQETFSAAMTAAAVGVRGYAHATYIGATMSPDATGALPVLYFSTRALDAWTLADDAAAVIVAVGASNRSELRRGFEVVLTEQGGITGVRLSFDATTVASTQWSQLPDEFSSVSFPVVFDRAASYEWLPGSDWINTTDPDTNDPDDRLPPQSAFPRARFDDAAIRRVVSEANYNAPFAIDDNLTASVTVDGKRSARRVAVTLSIAPDDGITTVSDMAATPIAYMLRRLSADPTIASVAFKVYLEDAEACTLVFTHARIVAIDWASFRDYTIVHRLFSLASTYRWTNRAAWNAELKENDMSARTFPLSKP